MSVSNRETILDGLDLVILLAINRKTVAVKQILAAVRSYRHWSEYKRTALRQRLIRLAGRGMLESEEKEGRCRLHYKASEQGLASLRISLSFYRSV